MKKFFIGLIIVILLLLGAAYGLLFSDSGNKLIAKYAQDELNKRAPGLVIKDFKLRSNSLDLKLSYLNLIDAKVGGEISLAKLSLNLLYTITSNNLESLGIKEKIYANGDITGPYKDLHITSKGDILGSALNASARVVDFTPAQIKLNVQNLAVGKLAKIAKYPIIDGSINANVDAQSLAQIMANITGNVKFNKAANALAKGVDLASLGDISLLANAQSKEAATEASVNLRSDKLSIDLSDIKFSGNLISMRVNAASKDIAWINPNLHTDFNLNADVKKAADDVQIKGQINGKNLNVPNLSAKINLANIDAQASLLLKANAALIGLKSADLANATINADISKGALKSADAKGIVLGGNLIAKLADDRLSASLKHASLDQALVLANAPAAISAYFDADANISKLSTLEGQVQANLSGNTNPKYFMEQMQLAINTPLSASIVSKLKGPENISFDIKSQSGLIDSLNIKGSLVQNALKADYTSEANLANFNALLKKNMSGQFKLYGKLQASSKDLQASVLSDDFLGAKLNANLNNLDFNAQLDKVYIPKFAKAFDFADIYAANAKANVVYNLKTQQGKVHADLEQGHLQPKPVISIINALINNDLGKIVFNNGRADIDLSAKSAKINAALNAQNASVLASNGEYDLLSKNLELPLAIKLNTTEIKGQLKGDVDHLKFVPDAANTISNVLHLVDKFQKQKSPEASDGDSKPDAKSAIKGLLNNLIRK